MKFLHWRMMSLSTGSIHHLTSSIFTSFLNYIENADKIAPFPPYTTSPNQNKNEPADKTATNNNSYNQKNRNTASTVISIGNLKLKNGKHRNNTKLSHHTPTSHNLKNHYQCEDAPGD
eukprot:106514_1